ncbi:MAG: zinc finger AN1 domain-containing stress-associated protein [Candidatus Bathyarchaeia archaeon]
MPQCEYCGKEVDLPFECKFCGGYYCLEHRLPESHSCPNLPPRTPLGSWQTKKEIAIAHAEEKKGKFVSEGELHFIKEEGKSERKEVRKPFPTKKVVGVLILVSVMGVLIWQLPVILSYFQNLSYKKLTITNGQIQDVEFNGNKFGILYSHDPSAGDYHTLAVATPAFQVRIYRHVYKSQVIHCDLGLEIKVDEVTDSYITIYVKPSY